MVFQAAQVKNTMQVGGFCYCYYFGIVIQEIT